LIHNNIQYIEQKIDSLHKLDPIQLCRGGTPRNPHQLPPI